MLVNLELNSVFNLFCSLYRSILTILFIISILSCQRLSKDKIVNTQQLNESEEVISYLTNLIEENQNNAQIYYKRGQVYFDLDDYRRAGIDIQKALELKPDNPDYYLLQSKIKEKKDDSKGAIFSALQAEQRGLRNYDLYRIMAVNYLKLDEIEDAKKSIQRLLDFNSSGESYSLQGDIFLQMNDTVTSVNSYKKAIELQRELPSPYLSLYKIYQTKRQNEMAEQYIDSYLNIMPYNKEFNLLKARLLFLRNEYDSALILYKRFEFTIANNKELLTEVGNVYYKLLKYDSSLFLANSAIGIDSLFLEANLLAARSKDNLKQYDEAIVIYRSIIERDSTINIAQVELDNLNGKVAYLWRLQRQAKSFDSIRNSPPPTVERKEANN
jgi:tetratricopeptide (TPR) repeat protein